MGISVTNHYTGFGTATVNNFLELMDLPQISIEHRNDAIISKYCYFSKSNHIDNKD